MISIQASGGEPIPSWALRQRKLIDLIDQAAGLFMEKYVHRGGTLRDHGKLDDDYECFNSWPLFYVLGGSEKVLDWSISAWNGITRQWTYQHQQAVDQEFVKHYDMLHLSEGYVGFQNFGLADPQIPENVDRARRFAEFYVDSEAGNYDRELRLIRSPITGSGGPLFSESADYVLRWGHASLYPLIEDLEFGWEKDPTRRAEIQGIYDEVVVNGDVPMNLAITGLVSHAFILTGEEKFRGWVLEYVDAWMDRTEKNGGIIPDNVGPSGRIGEKRGGQWWGGFFGWTGRYSVWMMFHALITATECAFLLSGDKKYLDFLRSQVDYLLDLAITRDGNLLVPYKIGPDGWHDFRPLDPYVLSHLWHASGEDQDWDRLERLRTGVRNGPHAYAYADSPDPPEPGSEEWRPDGVFDWNYVRNDLYGNRFVENESAHLRFLAGDNPNWPEKILDATFVQVERNMERLRDDEYVHPWKSQTLTAQNPVFTAGLGQMTLGAPNPCFNGGLLCSRLRYFDSELKRPGLPKDVAALAETIEDDRTGVRVVNTSGSESRRIIVQAGAYREHRFTEVQWVAEDGKELREVVEDSFFEVALAPGSNVLFDLGTSCNVGQPSYAFPLEA
jgi:hypothetical protein